MITISDVEYHDKIDLLKAAHLWGTIEIIGADDPAWSENNSAAIALCNRKINAGKEQADAVATAQTGYEFDIMTMLSNPKEEEYRVIYNAEYARIRNEALEELIQTLLPVLPSTNIHITLRDPRSQM